MNLNKYKHIVFSVATGSLLLAGLFLLLNGTSQIARADPGDLFVSSSASGNACTQASPCALSTALSQATDGDTIYVAGGTYTGAGAAVITITRSITLYGGWDGASSGPVVRDPALYPTTLDGEGERRGVYVSGPLTVTLEGFTVTNGVALDKGAGLYAEDTNLTLRAMTFYSNVVDSGSTTYTFGGGAYVHGGSLAVISSTFRANDAWCNGCGQTGGGGLCIYGTLSATIENSLFEANDAWKGSGLMFDGGWGTPILIRHTTFQDNGWGLSPGSGLGSYGGGASLGQAEAVVEDSTFLHNKAFQSSGALHFEGRVLSFNRNLVADNVAYWTAGIEIWNADFSLINNLVVDNQPRSGASAAIRILSPSSGTLLHNTIARNSGPSGGYGILMQSMHPVTLTNTILVSHTLGINVSAGSTATLEATLWGSGAWANGSDWGGDGTVITGTVNIWSDPAFVDPDGGDYHLGPASAAVDAGVNAGVTTDMDGDARPLGAGYDIGADEFIIYRLYLPLVLKNQP